jgi:hypothetical protein
MKPQLNADERRSDPAGGPPSAVIPTKAGTHNRRRCGVRELQRTREQRCHWRHPCLSAFICGLMLLAGCAEAPPPTVPVIAALSATGDYGHSEEVLAPDRYTVAYVTPSLSAHGDPEHDYGLAPERQRARDLALLRAAELALERGYPAFRVESESRDLELDIVDPPGPPPFVTAAMRTMSGPPCRWNCDNPIGYWGDPYFNPAYDNWYRRAHSSGRAAATLTVTLLPHHAPGAEDAASTAARLRQVYAQSLFDIR